MKKLFFFKGSHEIIPADDESIEVLKKFNVGSVFKAEYWKDREYWRHKRIFKLAKLITDNSERFTSPYQLIKAVQLDIGSVDMVKNIRGEVIQYPKSLKFNKMDDVEFDQLYKDFRYVIESNLHILLPRMSKEDFRRIADEIYCSY